MNATPASAGDAVFVALHGRGSSVLIECPPGEAPLWRYWGPRLPTGSGAGPALRSVRSLPTFTPDFDQPLSIFPTFGVGWFAQAALAAERGGPAFAQHIDACEVHWLDPGRAVRFDLTDRIARLRVELTLRLDAASDVLLLRTRLVNTGADILQVQALAAGTLPLPGAAQTVRSYAGQHNHEFLLQQDRLGRSLWRRESRRGRTSHDCFPGAVVTTAGTTEHAGLAFGAHLAWSGNHQQTIEWLPDGRYQWQWGEWLAPGEVRLAPGAAAESPELVATCSTQGLNGVAANFHAELRARLAWPGGAMAPRPVHLNTWEAVYFDHDQADLMDFADAAAALGIERFVLDDGWFHGRRHDRAALGDWWPDEGKYPHGLAPLAAHVLARGMAFGLWVEPEMINPASELYRAHPDWALQLAGRPLVTARNQLVLDISRREVADHLFSRLDVLLRSLPITYLKWDHNRDLTTAGLADGTAGYRAQVLAVYALLDRLRAAHPQVEIESCSGGGGRIDFGILGRTHRVWASDCIDALSRVDIQRGFLQFFPPEIMGSHIGSVPFHTTGRTQAMALRGAVALAGHAGVEMDPRRLDDAQRAELSRWIALYKRWRGLLHGTQTWLGEAGDGLVWQAHGRIDGRADELLVIVLRTRPTDHRWPPAVALPMLDGAARYAVQRIDPEPPAVVGRAAPAGATPPEPHNSAAWFAALRDAPAEFDGAWLAHAGLPVPRLHAEAPYIVHLRRL